MTTESKLPSSLAAQPSGASRNGSTTHAHPQAEAGSEKPRKSPLRWLVLAVALLLIGGGIWAWQRHEQALKAAEGQFSTTKIDRGRITARVTATGTLSALVTVQVGSQVSGRISALN